MTDPHASSNRVDDRYPGEPAPVEMVRDLQRALFGASYASPRSPADEWAYLLDCVSEQAAFLRTHRSDDDATPDRVRQDGTRVLAAYRATRDLTLGEASRIEHAMLRAAVLAERKLNEANRG